MAAASDEDVDAVDVARARGCVLVAPAAGALAIVGLAKRDDVPRTAAAAAGGRIVAAASARSTSFPTEAPAVLGGRPTRRLPTAPSCMESGKESARCGEKSDELRKASQCNIFVMCLGQIINTIREWDRSSTLSESGTDHQHHQRVG